MYKKIDNSEALSTIGPAFEELTADEMEISDGMGASNIVTKATVKATKWTSVYCAVGLSISVVSYSIIHG